MSKNECHHCGRYLTENTAGVIFHDSGAHGSAVWQKFLDILISPIIGNGYYYYYCNMTCVEKDENGRALLSFSKNPNEPGFRRLK